MSENIFSNLLDDAESKAINAAAKTVKDQAYLGLGVYPMVLESWERKKDKNEVPFLRANINTGYEKKDGGARMLTAMFYLSGQFPDGRNKIDDLVRFLKSCFKITAIGNEAIQSTCNKRIAVATKKDADGYIQFWYAEPISSLDEARRKYTAKRDDPRTGEPTIAVSSKNKPQADPNTPDFLEGIEESDYQGEEPEGDDLPFK